MEKVQHQSTVQSNFRLFPKGIILRCIFRRGVLDKVIDQPKYIRILADVAEGIVVVRMGRVNEIKNPDMIPMAQKKASCGAKDLPLGICNDEAGIAEHYIGENHTNGLLGTAAAHYNLQQIPVMVPGIQAHLQILGENHIPFRVFVPVLAV